MKIYIGRADAIVVHIYLRSLINQQKKNHVIHKLSYAEQVSQNQNEQSIISRVLDRTERLVAFD